MTKREIANNLRDVLDKYEQGGVRLWTVTAIVDGCSVALSDHDVTTAGQLMELSLGLTVHAAREDKGQRLGTDVEELLAEVRLIADAIDSE